MCEACRDFDRRSKGRSPKVQAKCGTRSGYNRHRYRGEKVCGACMKANALASRQYRERRRPVPLDPWDPRHGTINGYSNHACHCGPCKAANARASQDYRDSHKDTA